MKFEWRKSKLLNYVLKIAPEATREEPVSDKYCPAGQIGCKCFDEGCCVISEINHSNIYSSWASYPAKGFEQCPWPSKQKRIKKPVVLNKFSNYELGCIDASPDVFSWTLANKTNEIIDKLNENGINPQF